MKLLVATLKTYWKLLVALVFISSTLVAGAAWVGRVDTHVVQGNEAMIEFKQSQIDAARVEVKVEHAVKGIDELKDETKDIKQQLQRIERKLDRGTR